MASRTASSRFAVLPSRSLTRQLLAAFLASGRSGIKQSSIIPLSFSPFCAIYHFLIKKMPRGTVTGY